MEPTPSSLKWWQSEKPAETITAVIKRMVDNSMPRLRDYRIGAVLYGATDLWGPYVNSTMLSSALPLADSGRLRLNVTQSCTDTLQSDIGKNTPRPMYLTSGGDWMQQRQAEKLTALMDGVFAENKTYVIGKEGFRDGCVLGDGFIYAGIRHKRAHHERVPAWELFVDDAETISGGPRQMHRCRLIDRAVLQSMFPKMRKQLENVNSGQIAFPAPVTTNLSDLVELHESWRLPSGPDEKDGLYVASVNDLTIEKKPWKRQFFPFARYQWCKRTGGYWSQGLAEQLKPIQLDINREAALIQQSHYRQTTFDIWVPVGSKVSTDKISNEVGGIKKFSGPQPPFTSSPPIAQPERYRWLQWQVEKAYEIAGVSQMAASSVIPAGVESGKAMRTLANVGSARFRSAAQDYDQFYVDIANITIAAIEDYVEETGEDYPVKAPSWTGFDTLNFKEIKLARKDYVIQVFPTSSLPNEPAGRIQEIEDLEKRGRITPRTAQRLFDFPDVAAANELLNAAENYAVQLFDRMYDGTYTAPDPRDDLEMLYEMALQHYNLWRQQDVGEEVLELLRTFIKEVGRLIELAKPPAPPMMPAAGGPPSMTPMPNGAAIGAMPMPVPAM